jgi:hypothetical protein
MDRAGRHSTDQLIVARKLAAIRAATQYEFPTSDIDNMLAEIEIGYFIEIDSQSRGRC